MRWVPVAWLLSLLAAPAAAQTYVDKLAIGVSDSGSSASVLVISGLGARTPGQGVLSISGTDVFAGALGTADIPSQFTRRDIAETINQAWGFASTVSVTGLATLTGGFTAGAASTVNANLTIGGASDLILGTGGLRAGSGATLVRNVADSATIASFGDSAIALNQNTAITGTASVSSTLGVTGLSTLTGGFSAGAASTVNATLGVTGLTTLADVQATGYRGVSNPFTVEATDGTTPILRAYDAGRAWIGNTGTDAYWEYNATGNPSGQRNWRVGLVGGNFRVDAGNDAASSWSNLLRTTMAAGVPNGLYWGTGVSEVSPDQDFQTNLGNFGKQYANLWVRNLWSTTLVAQDLISTIGGAVNVGPTTTLEADIAAGATTILTAHNEMAVGDVAYLNANLGTEFMQVTSGPTAAGSSLSFVSAADAAATTLTLPTHAAGDLIVMVAFNNAATAPTIPGGWTASSCGSSGGGGSGTGTGYRVAYKVAASGAETSGTWTNTTHLLAHVYRSSTGVVSAPGDCVVTPGTGTSMTYPALTLTKTDGTSWVLRAGFASAGTNIQTVPSGGFTFRADVGSAPESATFDTNGPVAGSSIAASSAITIASSNWRTITIEIVGLGIGPFTYGVTRGYGGVFAARAWESGAGLFNTGAVGDGHINMYAIQSIKGSGEQGPTIAGNVRTSTTYNGWATRWALGNLRGLYNYGATDVFGAAFGNASDVWLGVDATNGVRFWEGGTTQTAQFALDGSILLGQTGSGQANTLITPTSLALRRGTVEHALLDSTGLLLGTAGAGEENVLVTSSSLAMRQGTVKRFELDATSMRFYDTGGVNYPVELATTASYFGYQLTGYSHIGISNTGVFDLKNGSTVRMRLAASNGDMQFFGTDGTRTLVVTGTAIEIGRPVSNNPVLNLTSSTMSFCRFGSTCPLVFDGATGNITSTGGLSIQGNASIGGSGSFAASGITLTASGISSSTSATFEDGKSYRFAFNANGMTNGGLYAYTDSTNNVLQDRMAGTSAADDYRVEQVVANGLTTVSTQLLGGVTGLQWGAYVNDGVSEFNSLVLTKTALFIDGHEGETETITVRNAAGTGTCTITFVMGVKVGGTC